MAKLSSSGTRVHRLIGFVALANATALPIAQFMSMQCTRFLWYNQCDFDMHMLHMVLAAFNWMMVLVLTTVWDPTNEARTSIKAFLLALPNLFGNCCGACKEKCLAKLPLPAGIRNKLGLPPNGAALMDESSDEEEEDDSESDEENAQPAAAPAPAPAPGREDSKRKGGLFKKSSSKQLPPPEKLPAPSPETKTPSRKDVKQIA